MKGIDSESERERTMDYHDCPASEGDPKKANKRHINISTPVIPAVDTQQAERGAREVAEQIQRDSEALGVQ